MAPHEPLAVPRDEDISFTKRSPGTPVFNYYFLLLVLLVVLVVLVFWLIHRRKVRQTARRNGQQAPARDIEAWPGIRRLIHERYGAGNSVLLRRTEGLNEEGEAPPPYQPKTAMLVTVPMRTLPMDESDRSEPPRYCDGEYMPSAPNARREVANTDEEHGTKS